VECQVVCLVEKGDQGDQGDQGDPDENRVEHALAKHRAIETRNR